MRKRGFVMLTVLAIALTLGIGVFLGQSMLATSATQVQSQIDGLKPVFTTIRFLVIGLVALLWPVITRGLCRCGSIDGAGAVRLLSLRWRIVTWLLVIELMLGQNLPGRFLVAMQGASS